MPSPGRQTVSYLIQRFREAGIVPRPQLGQSFLTDLNLVELLVKTADVQPNDVVLEVGTGAGSVTSLVAPRAAAVVTVEVDRSLFQLASEELYALGNVRMLNADALRNKNRLNPEVVEAVERELAAGPGRSFKLVANLPYNVATPVITNLLALDRAPRTMTVTIQKELADRMAARPGAKDYGALSVWVQSQCRVEIVRVMSPSVFWPRPKVHSAIVHVGLDDALRARLVDRAFFHAFVRAIFLHRRKFLRSQLASAVKGRLEKAESDAILASLGLGGDLRAEQLGVEAMLALSGAVRTALTARGSASTMAYGG